MKAFAIAVAAACPAAGAHAASFFTSEASWNAAVTNIVGLPLTKRRDNVANFPEGDPTFTRTGSATGLRAG